MKPLQGLAKVDFVQFVKDRFGSCRDWLRWVRHASSLGSDNAGRKTAPVSTVANSRIAPKLLLLLILLQAQAPIRNWVLFCVPFRLFFNFKFWVLGEIERELERKRERGWHPNGTL